MPTSVMAVVVITIAVFPGIAGNTIYRALVGIDWRERDWEGVVRVIGFSIIGLVLYLVFAAMVPWIPDARHVFPSTYAAPSLGPGRLGTLVWPYLGHWAGSGLAGLLAALSMRRLARWTGSFASPSAWDEFVKALVPGHWVAVGLTNGDVYLGKMRHSDISVTHLERDIVLAEPAQFSEERSHYVATEHQYLFLPAKLIASIAIIHEPGLDRRSTEIGARVL